MGLRAKIFLITTIPIFFVIGVIIHLAARDLKNAVNQGYITKGTAIINFSEDKIKTIDELYNPLHLEVLVEDIIKTYQDVYRISIYAPVKNKVTVIGGSDPERIGEPAESEDEEPIKTANIIFYEKMVEGKKMIKVLGPLHIKGKTVASMGVYIPLTPSDKLVTSRMTRYHLTGMIGLLFLVVLLNLFLVNYIINPIRQLQTASYNLAKGNFTTRAAITGKDELGRLAETFNDMVNFLQAKQIELEETRFEAVMALAQAIEAKDLYTRGHSERTANYALQIADKLGLSDEEKGHIKYAAVLHDIGKIGIKGAILNKPGSLSEAEYEEIKTHPQKGVDIIRPVRFLAPVIPLILYHQERWDGKGYPEGLAGDKIPIGSRIISVLDARDAMTSDRPYRKALSREEAIRELKRCSGTQFDPKVVEVFLEIIEGEQ